jgi:hypothetical protein
MGQHTDYRPAKIRREMWLDPGSFPPGEDNDEEDEDYDSEDDDDDTDQFWPKPAHHKEGYFGYAFDAGENRICKGL